MTNTTTSPEATTTGAGTTTDEAVAPVVNLRASRKEQAAKKAPAKKAPAKKAAAKVESTSRKLRWTGDVAAADGVEYELVKSGDKWSAVVRKGGKTTVLVENVGRVASYKKAVEHYRASA